MTFAVGALGVGTTVHFNCISGKYVAEVWTCFTLEKEQIEEAYEHILAIRSALMEALGKAP